MACRDAYQTNINTAEAKTLSSNSLTTNSIGQLLFGVDSKKQANDILQNNIDEFEWVVRNKLYPNFYGRYITGENCLTKDEIDFIHQKGCKIAIIYTDDSIKITEEQGTMLAKKIDIRAFELGITAGTTIFLEIKDNENVPYDFMRGFIKTLIIAGFTPGFKANTDARFTFDHEFSRGLLNDNDLFSKCLIWSVSPTMKEYSNLTTSHVIHPENWTPYAPSGLTRSEIAIWQYGIDCHPIENDEGTITSFNLNLVRNKQIILKNMF